MHQEPPNGSNFSPTTDLSKNTSTSKCGSQNNSNDVNVKYIAISSRCPLVGRSTITQGSVNNQPTMSPTAISAKTPFSVAKGGTSHTIPQFNSPNKKMTIPHMVKPPLTQKVKVEVKEEFVEEDPSLLRERILQTYLDSIEEIKSNFKEKLQELFFVQSGGNMVDYPAWKQRPNPHLLSFLSVYRLDDTTTLSTPTATNTVSPLIKMQSTYSTPAGSGSVSQLATPSNSSYPYSDMDSPSPLTVTTTLAQYGFVQTALPSSTKKSCSGSAVSSCSTSLLIKQEPLFCDGIESSSTDCKPTIDASKCPSSTPPHTSSSAQTTSPSAPPEGILGQVRHESDVVQRISRLRKGGLWSASRLPKVYEPPRKKCQWDFLLEEMQWLAADFAQEKKWKRSMGKKVQ